MTVKERILAIIKRKGVASGSEIGAKLGITRQALNRHVQRLLAEGRLIRDGVTRGARYRLARGKVPARPPTFQQNVRLRGLQEDRVFDQVVGVLGLERALPENVRRIVEYAFTEMLNNAIEHSRADRAEIRCTLSPLQLTFAIRERGVGIFASIAGRFRLADETEAVGELLKGKTTSRPESHSGEGVFFTSKLADRFELQSHRLRVTFDPARQDVFVGEARHRPGTRVDFTIKRQSRRRLDEVFAEFAPERHDFQFDRTRVQVKLFQKDYVSRSEARRLLAGLDKFREVELDFRGVASIGQGFADEVFRVFARAHPDIRFTTARVNPAVQALIKHVAPAQSVELREEGTTNRR